MEPRKIKSADMLDDAPYEEGGKWIVREQLYPESRGWIVHEFETEEAAKAAIEGAE